VTGQAPEAASGVLNAAMTLALVAAGGRDPVQNKPGRRAPADQLSTYPHARMLGFLHDEQNEVP
jgi:hypothetical protein